MPNRTTRTWTTEEQSFLRANLPTIGVAGVAEALGRTPKSVRNYSSRHRLLGSPFWTEDDVMTLRAWYEKRAGHLIEPEKLAQVLDRSLMAVMLKASELGFGDRHRTNGRKERVRQFQTDEDRNAATSKRMRAYLAEHGHPRGALGMRHTVESKSAMSHGQRLANARRTPEQEAERVRKRNMTNIEIYGTANPGFENQTNPYSRGKRGYALDLPGMFFRSSWEVNYARYLEWLKDQGEIQEWAYEPQRFVFHGVTRAPVTYCPDFRIVEGNGDVVFHEVKGWMDSASKSKLKRMKKFYPDVQVIVVDKDGYNALARSVSAIVPHWGEDLVKKEKVPE